MDVFSKDKRSQIMRRVKGRDTTPELIVRRALHAMGYRYRLCRADLPGKPDLVFPSRRCVIFIHGCFWHMHRCKRGRRVPKTNTEYWALKRQRNRARDQKHRRKLRSLGWRVLVVWECRLHSDKRDATLEKVVQFLEDA